MRILERIQANPTVNALVWLGGIVLAVVTASIGGAFAADERYMRKDEAMVALKAANEEAKTTRKLIEYQADVNRKRQLEDNIFQYNLKPDKQKTQADRAMAERYKLERQDLIDRWQREGMPLK
jgi:hypothetical protein